jgi:hypothetical protein
MKLSYRVVTLSYCPDLVDPNAPSIPFAVLVAGKTDTGAWTAFSMGVDIRKLGVDRFLAGMLGDVPHLVRSHFDSAMKRIKTELLTPEAVLREFHEVLRTNVFVSNLSDEVTLEVEDPLDLTGRLIEVGRQTLRAEVLRQAVPLRSGVQPWTPRVDPATLFAQPPQVVQWEPRVAA